VDNKDQQTTMVTGWQILTHTKSCSGAVVKWTYKWYSSKMTS